MIEGKIVAKNEHIGMYAVETPNGYTVFELLDTNEINIGDIISGNLYANAGETLVNKTNDESMNVFIEGFYCTAQAVKSMLKLQ